MYSVEVVFSIMLQLSMHVASLRIQHLFTITAYTMGLSLFGVNVFWFIPILLGIVMYRNPWIFQVQTRSFSFLPHQSRLTHSRPFATPLQAMHEMGNHYNSAYIDEEENDVADNQKKRS